jgi:hypothetical protein
MTQTLNYLERVYFEMREICCGGDGLVVSVNIEKDSVFCFVVYRGYHTDPLFMFSLSKLIFWEPLGYL